MLSRAATWALRAGLRKGVLGGSGPWLVVAVAAGAYRLLHRPVSGASALTLKLEPGERYSILCSDEPIAK